MINRISQLAPEKDLKRYYIRDALGNLARFTNDKVIMVPQNHSTPLQLIVNVV